MIDFDNLTAEIVLSVGNSRRSCGINHNTESICVFLSGKKFVLIAEERHIVGKITVLEQNFLPGEGKLKNSLKAFG